MIDFWIFWNLKLSLFFDILLAACNGITKENYLQGSFKSNNTANNQQSIIRQARSILWNAFHSNSFTISNITVKDAKFFYMNNETFQHRKDIFQSLLDDKNPLANLSSLQTNNSLVVSVNSFANKQCHLEIADNVNILNCNFESCEIAIGENCHLSDLVLVTYFL